MSKGIILFGSLLFVVMIISLFPERSCAGYGKESCAVTPTPLLTITPALSPSPSETPSTFPTPISCQEGYYPSITVNGDSNTVTSICIPQETPIPSPTETPAPAEASGGYTNDHLGCGEHSCAPAQVQPNAAPQAPNTGHAPLF